MDPFSGVSWWCLFLLALIVGIILNIFNIIVFTRKCMKQPINNLLLCISVCDLISFPYNLMDSLSQRYYFFERLDDKLFAIIRFIFYLFALTGFALHIFTAASRYTKYSRRRRFKDPDTISIFAVSIYVVLFVLYCPLVSLHIAIKTNPYDLLDILEIGYTIIFEVLPFALLMLLVVAMTFEICTGGRPSGHYQFPPSLSSASEQQQQQHHGIVGDDDSSSSSSSRRSSKTSGTLRLVLLVSILTLLTNLPVLLWHITFLYIHYDGSQKFHEPSLVDFVVRIRSTIYISSIIQTTVKIFIYYAISGKFRKTANRLLLCNCRNDTGSQMAAAGYNLPRIIVSKPSR